jgi:hypothetical protein|tara:strand:+ start:206 stop:487 length:282 start_codon:yes stop_codon:yes gene_type:complete
MGKISAAKTIFGLAKKGFGMLGKKQKTTGKGAINSVAPKVNKTPLDKAKSGLAIQTQKTKASTARLKQTTSEIKNKEPLTFEYKGKTIRNSDK